jgi:polyhydroxyalkanoate synthesis regulator phasin
MDERLKSLIYMGVGLASTSQKAKLLLEKMDMEGHLSEEEGKRIIGEIMGGIKQEGAHLQEDVYRYMHEIFNELDTPSKTEYYALQQRVEKLEKILIKMGHDV